MKKGVSYIMDLKINKVTTIFDTKKGFPRVAPPIDEKETIEQTVANDIDVDTVSSRILTKHIKAFEELAK